MDTSSWETHPKTWTEMESTCSTKTARASGCPVDAEEEEEEEEAKGPKTRTTNEGGESHRPACPSLESWSCSRCEISFMRDFLRIGSHEWTRSASTTLWCSSGKLP